MRTRGASGRTVGLRPELDALPITEVTDTHVFALTANDAGCVHIAGRAAGRALGEHRVDIAVDPVMASQDFGVLARSVPPVSSPSATAPNQKRAAYHSTATTTSSTTTRWPPASPTTTRSSRDA